MEGSPFTERISVAVDGGDLLVYRAGAAAGSGAPVVLAAHGITANHLAWAAVARGLGDAICLLAPDLRGRAASAAVGPPYGIDRHAADLAAVLDHTGTDRAVLAGHSMGTWVATLTADRHPARVSALVLVDGGISLPMPDGADPDAVMDAVLGPAIARLRLTFASVGDYRAWWRQHPAFSTVGGIDADLDAYIDHDLTGTPPELRSSAREDAVRADGTQLLLDEDVRSAIDRVAQPVQLLRAPRGLFDDPNPLVPAAAAAALAQARPHVEVDEIPDVNHYTIMFLPDSVATIVAAIGRAVSTHLTTPR